MYATSADWSFDELPSNFGNKNSNSHSLNFYYLICFDFVVLVSFRTKILGSNSQKNYQTRSN